MAPGLVGSACFRFDSLKNLFSVFCHDLEEIFSGDSAPDHGFVSSRPLWIYCQSRKKQAGSGKIDRFQKLTFCFFVCHLLIPPWNY